MIQINLNKNYKTLWLINNIKIMKEIFYFKLGIFYFDLSFNYAQQL